MKGVPMRLHLRGSALLLSMLVVAPAYAEDDIVDASAVRWGAERGEGSGASLLNIAVTDFGRPDPENPNSLPLTVGYGVDASLAQAYTNLGPCEVNAQLGQVGLEASVGMGSASTERGPGADRSVSALPECNLSAEANLVSVSAECETAVGTFEPTVKGPGAQAGCTCDGCEAGAYWVWGELTYTTPSVGGCGIKVSAEASVEGGVGAKAGAGRQGDVGARATLGPVGLGAGINIDEFDPGATADCVTDAARAVGGAVADGAQAVGGAIADGAQSVYDGAGRVVEGIENAADAAAESVSNAAGRVADGLTSLGGDLVDGIGGLFGGGGGGDNSPRAADTRPGPTSVGIGGDTAAQRGSTGVGQPR